MASGSLTDQAYLEIRRRIVTLELPPGAVIREDELQRELGIGRTPIREAIQRLEREQLVVVLPRRGVFVASVDVADLPLLCESRSMLEAYVARLAAVRGTTEDWDRLDAVLDTFDATASADALLALDRQCHEIVWSAAGNHFLTDTLDMLYTQSDRLWRIYLNDMAEVHEAINEHREIAEALRLGHGEDAAKLTEDHVQHFESSVREVISLSLRSPLA
jgi:DNA-binding GntR family transcriptional regulator